MCKQTAGRSADVMKLLLPCILLPYQWLQPKQLQIVLDVCMTTPGAEACSNAWLQLTGGISKGLAMLTLDQDYISRFRNRPMTYQQRLVYALQALGVGIYEGVIGQPASRSTPTM